MPIHRSFRKHGNLLPAGYNAVQSIPDEFVFSKLHEIRHPKSAYGASVRSIADHWCVAIKAIEELRQEFLWSGNVKDQGDVIREYQKLLYALNEHFDACFAVLRGICSTVKLSMSSDAQYLGAVDPVGWKSFRAAIRTYREEHLGYLVNRMKHNQAELAPMCFKSQTEFRPGYFLCDLLSEGVMGANEKLHCHGTTAFSYARDMLFHLWWMYRIGELLENAIATILQTSHDFVFKSTSHNLEITKWTELLDMCSKLKPEYFPDELIKPNIRLLFNNETASLDYSNNLRGYPFVGDYTISNQFTVDGAYPSMRMPYFEASGRTGQTKGDLVQVRSHLRR